MEDYALLTKNGKILYKGTLFGMMVIFLLMVTSCSESNLSPSESLDSNENAINSFQAPPTVITSGPELAAVVGELGIHRMKNHDGQNSGFTSPLFGLATAPNGDVLVADAGAGVATSKGKIDMAFPGITDLSPIGRGTSWALKGLTGDPGDNTGQALYKVSKGKNWMIADLFAFEQEHNPDGAELVDSNPFHVESLGGDKALVADAGGNDLLEVDDRGNIKVLVVFPNEMVSTDNVKNELGCSMIPEPDRPPICSLPPQIPAQAVPTSIAIGPDGYYYVGELKGFPAPVGVSNIWRVSPDAHGAMCGSSPDCQKVFDGGFTSIIDMAFDGSGHLYVAELDESSWFAVEFGAGVGGTINKCDVTAATCTEVATGIPILTAITFGTNGDLWATQNALIPGLAEVIKVE